MTRTQIYELVNTLQNITAYGADIEVVDHSSFISYGELINSTTGMKDVVYNALLDIVGKTIIAIDEYSSKDRNITRLPFDFGALLTKISFQDIEAKDDSDWKFPTGDNPYTVSTQGGIIQKVFKRKLGVFEYTDVAMTRQLNSAFKSEEEFGGFVEGLYQRMRNARELAKENLENATIGALAVEVNYEVDESTNTNRVRHLLTEYKVLNPTSTLTSETCKRDFGFLTYVATEMWNVLPFMERLTATYNDGSVTRVTRKEDLIVEVVSQFSNFIDIYLKSNTYHDNLIKLPNYSEIPYWQYPSSPYYIAATDSDGQLKDVENVIAIYRDRDACACTFEYERTVSKYDEWNDRVPFKMTAERNYMVDTTENVIIWCCD